METIDITPTWEGLLPMLLELRSRGTTKESRKTAGDELLRMAKIADLHVAENGPLKKSEDFVMLPLRRQVRWLSQLPPHDPDRTETVDGLGSDSMSNGRRAMEAADVISRPYNGEYADAVCNILHAAHGEGLNPEEVLQKALAHFLNEAGPL